MTQKAASKSKQSKPASSVAGLTPGLTLAQSRALKLIRKGTKFTTSDLHVALLTSTNHEIGSLSLARAHVRAWVKAGAVTAVVAGSQGVAGVYKRVK